MLSGSLDREFRVWFGSAPQAVRTYWTYWHEPEDDVEAGSLPLAGYRAAWRHLRTLANQADNPRLRATLVLMCWTLNPSARRNWRDYYAGRRTIQVLGWDCYNAGHRQGVYGDPATMLRPASRLARRIGKPWGIAELGSVLIAGGQGVRTGTVAEGGRRVLSASIMQSLSPTAIPTSELTTGSAMPRRKTPGND